MRQLKKPANCDTVCQVTRGRQPQWADTPLAKWIRQQLDGRPKTWLIDQISQRNKGNLEAAEALVNRWTYRGEPAHAQQLQQASIDHLTAIFDQSPLSTVSDPARLAEAIGQLREAMEAVLLLLPPPGQPRAASERPE